MKINRHELVERIAFERAEYELQYASREDGWQPIVAFTKASALRIARHNDVERIRRVEGEYSVSFYPRIDWKRLAKDVERRVPRFKRDLVEFEGAL